MEERKQGNGSRTVPQGRDDARRRAEHSGEGSATALKRMKLWERARAMLRGGNPPRDKPAADDA